MNLVVFLLLLIFCSCRLVIRDCNSQIMNLNRRTIGSSDVRLANIEVEITSEEVKRGEYVEAIISGTVVHGILNNPLMEVSVFQNGELKFPFGTKRICGMLIDGSCPIHEGEEMSVRYRKKIRNYPDSWITDPYYTVRAVLKNGISPILCKEFDIKIT